MNNDKLYDAIESIIVRGVIDGTKTAGSLTREIMSIIEILTNPRLQMEWGEGWFATSYWGDQDPTQPGVCPYDVGTRQYESWMMGHDEYLKIYPIQNIKQQDNG
jgi:hypothetical protein